MARSLIKQIFHGKKPDQTEFVGKMSLIKQSLLVKREDWTMWTDESSQNKIFVAMSQNKLYLYRLLLEKLMNKAKYSERPTDYVLMVR